MPSLSGRSLCACVAIAALAAAVAHASGAGTAALAPFDDAETANPQAYYAHLTKHGYRNQLPAAGNGPVMDPRAMEALRAESAAQAADFGAADSAGAAAAARFAAAAADERQRDVPSSLQSNGAAAAKAVGKAAKVAGAVAMEAAPMVLDAVKKNSGAALELAKAMHEKMQAALGTGNPQPTMTDSEWCNGCQLVLSQVLEHTDDNSEPDEILFAMHSACHETPPILREACDVLIDRDHVALDALLLSRDVPRVCYTIGMCYPELIGLDATGNPAGEAAGGKGGKAAKPAGL